MSLTNARWCIFITTSLVSLILVVAHTYPNGHLAGVAQTIRLVRFYLDRLIGMLWPVVVIAWMSQVPKPVPAIDWYISYAIGGLPLLAEFVASLIVFNERTVNALASSQTEREAHTHTTDAESTTYTTDADNNTTGQT